MLQAGNARGDVRVLWWAWVLVRGLAQELGELGMCALHLGTAGLQVLLRELERGLGLLALGDSAREAGARL
eukprot:2598319-Alexandrium_andersonii.AAC.1